MVSTRAVERAASTRGMTMLASPAKAPGEALEPARLGDVVELAEELRAHGRERVGGGAGAELVTDDAAQQRRRRQIVAQRLGDAGVLHLDREAPAVGVLGGVHLAERRGGDGRVVPARERASGGAPSSAVTTARIAAGGRGGMRSHSRASSARAAGVAAAPVTSR